MALNMGAKHLLRTSSSMVKSEGPAEAAAAGLGPDSHILWLTKKSLYSLSAANTLLSGGSDWPSGTPGRSPNPAVQQQAGDRAGGRQAGTVPNGLGAGVYHQHDSVLSVHLTAKIPPLPGQISPVSVLPFLSQFLLHNPFPC